MPRTNHVGAPWLGRSVTSGRPRQISRRRATRSSRSAATTASIARPAPAVGHDGSIRVVLVRHGETAWSRAGRHTGRTDLPLLEEGIRQAEAVGVRLRAFTFAQVWCSPLTRARETCAHAGLTDQATVEPDLMEWDYGDYEGRRTPRHPRRATGLGPDVRRRAERRDLRRRRGAGRAGHRPLPARGRRRRVRTRPRAARPGGAMARPRAAGGRALLLSPCTVSILGRDRGVPVVALWNDGGHLEG